MHTLVYNSEASWFLSRYELFLLLHESRKNNARYQISGLLLYLRGAFIQVIEGDKDNIDRLYSNIKKDYRNRNVNLLVYKEIENRRFNDWSMGFVNVSEEEKRNILGLSRFLDSNFDISRIASMQDEVYALLLDFRKRRELESLVETD